ncbi:MFS transporter [Francisellaceae bacterium]|nr:MFS transporter [Francisellaceae bacterium]
MDIKSKKLFSLCLILFIDAISAGIIIPILPELFLNSSIGLIGDQSHLRGLFYSLSIAIFPLCSLFSMPIFGYLSDIFGRKKFLFIGLSGILISYLIGAVAIYYHSIYIFLVSRFISGISVGTYTITNAMIADITETFNEKKLAYRWPTVAYLTGFIIGPLLGSLSSIFNDSHSLYIPFIIGSILASFNLIFVYKYITEVPISKKPSLISKQKVYELTHPIKNYINMIKSQDIKYLSLSYFALQLSTGLFIQSLNVRLAIQFSFGPKAIGFFFFVVSIGIILNSLTIQKSVYKRFSPKIIMTVSFTLIIGLLLTQLFGVNSIGIMTQPLMLSACIFIYILINLCAPMYTALFSVNSNQKDQGKIMAFCGQLYSVSWFSSGLLIGFLVFNDIHIIMILCISSLFISLCFIFRYFSQSENLNLCKNNHCNAI